MREFINAVSNLFRGIAALIVAGLIGLGTWLGYDAYTAHSQIEARLRQSEAEIAKKTAEIDQLSKDVAEKKRQIEKLDLALRLLKVDHRVAEVIVLDQWKSKVENRIMTKIAFQDIDDEGRPLARASEYTIEGDILYIDAWVVKYDDELVQAGDPLRSTSLCLFRRLFGEYQEPSEGFVLDQVDARPAAYGRGPMTDYEKELWTNFWEYSNDSSKAKKAGVRAAHGEAPSIKLLPHKLYKLQLRASGGLTIAPPEDIPPDRTKAL